MTIEGWGFFRIFLEFFNGQKKSQKASSTQGLPGRSPTPVLTGPSVAYLPSSNGIGSSPQSMAAGEKDSAQSGRVTLSGGRLSQGEGPPDNKCLHLGDPNADSLSHCV